MPPKKKVFHDSDSDVESIELDEDGVESDGADDLVGEESEDDGAPDDVTFTQSKADALMKVKDALATIGKAKERQKAKRRLRDDQFKQQKKQKLEELSKSRLPDDFLKTVASMPLAVEPEEPAETHAKGEHLSDVEPDDGASDAGSVESGFIPLGGSEVKAVYVNAPSKTSLTAMEQVKTFRQKALYGGKIRRVPEKTRRSMLTKRMARFL